MNERSDQTKNDATPETPDGEELAQEVRDLREEGRGVEPTAGFPGDPQAGGSGPGSTSN